MCASSAARRFSWSKLRTFRPKVPDKLKGGRLEKIGHYIMTIVSDYQSVAVETIQDMKDRPVKASIYIAGLATFGVFLKANPDHHSYVVNLQNASNDLLLVGDAVRNPKSDQYVRDLMWAHKDGLLKFQSFGVFSVVWMDNFPSRLDLFEAKCSQLKTPWYRFHETVVDTGYLGRWRGLEKAMVDYDVNPSEWQSSSDLPT